MQTTTNYGYNVPESGDAADITKISQNFIDIDEDIKEVSNGVTSCCKDLSDKLDKISNTLDSVNTTVENIPSSLDTKFSDINEGILEIDGKLSTLTSAISNIQYIISNTNAVVHDIYQGNQYSEWIQDLAQSGVNSSTYKDTSKMDQLIVYEQAILNTEIDDLLFKYIINNSKPVGNFFKTKLKDTSGDVTWDSLTTVDSICKSSAAYGKIVKDSSAFSVLIEGGQFKVIYNNYTITETLTINSSVAITKLNNVCKVLNGTIYGNQQGETPLNINGYVKNITANEYGLNIHVVYADGSSDNSKWTTTSALNKTIKRFVKSIAINSIDYNNNGPFKANAYQG